MQATFPDPYMTVIDACAEITRCSSVHAITQYAETLPDKIKSDDRFVRAVKNRLQEINSKRKSA